MDAGERHHRAAETDGSDAQDARGVSAEIERGRRLDERLAERLGHPAPTRSRHAGGYMESLDRRPILPPEMERRAIRAAQAGDADSRAQLVEAFLPHISSMARIYRTRHVQRQELVQEGVVGLLRALERFDPSRTVPFWAYASWWVRQAMQQLVSELTRPMVLSDRALRHLSRLKQIYHDEVQRTGRAPSRAELAELSGLGLEQIDDLLATERSRSLDEPLGGAEAEIGTLGELLLDPTAEGEYERVLEALDVAGLHNLLAGLSARERLVLEMRCGLDGPGQSLRQVGARLGISGERVRQIESRALGKLSTAMHSGTPRTEDDESAG